MPFSDPTAHPIFKEALEARKDRLGPSPHVLDCGVGVGLTGKLVKEVFPDANLTGLEIYAPYFTDDALRATFKEQYGLYHHLYDSLVLGGEGEIEYWLAAARHSWGLPEPLYDLVVFGDSLEHLERDSAELAFEDAQSAADCVLVTTPVAYTENGIDYWMPQGPMYGNEHETHQHYWTQPELEALGLKFEGKGKDSWVFAWDRQ